VRVVNRCRTEGGKTTEAVGLARQVGGPDSPKLQVRFAPAWLSWLPAVWGDYWIVDLDPTTNSLQCPSRAASICGSLPGPRTSTSRAKSPC
jgi:lipocalin